MVIAITRQINHKFASILDDKDFIVLCHEK